MSKVTAFRADRVPVDHEHALRRFRKLGYSPISRVTTLAVELVRCCRTQCSADSYGSEIEFYLRWCKVHVLDPLKVTQIDVEMYAASLSNYAVGTQHLKLLVPRLFYKRAIAHHWLRDNPVVIPRSIRRIPETNTPALDKAQVQQLLGAIRADFADPLVGLTARRDYALLTMMIRLCLRTTETTSLSWGKLVATAGRKEIGFMGKWRKPAHLMVPDDVFAILKNWRRAYEQATGVTLGPADPVFLPMDSRALKRARARVGKEPLPAITRVGIYQIVTKRMRDVKIEGDRFSPHCLRATGAVLAYHGGATIIQIKELLRHESIDTTMRYLQKLIGGAAAEAIDCIRLDVEPWVDEEGGQEPAA